MQTKGEAMILGIDKIREGLELISKLGDKQDLVKLLVSSPTAAMRLKDLMRNNRVFQTMTVSLVSAKNSRLASETVDKVITDFLDVLFDLSRPYKEYTEDPEEAVETTVEE
ncbi:MAG: hypothetical protein ACOYU3_07410 [Bacillota bacterium]